MKNLIGFLVALNLLLSNQSPLYAKSTETDKKGVHCEKHESKTKKVLALIPNVSKGNLLYKMTYQQQSSNDAAYKITPIADFICDQFENDESFHIECTATLSTTLSIHCVRERCRVDFYSERSPPLEEQTPYLTQLKWDLDASQDGSCNITLH